MASWEPVTASEPAPLPLTAAALRLSGPAALARQLAILRISQRALGQCLGARSGLWLTRSAGLGFVIAAAYAARPVPGALDALLRLLLVIASWCIGLGALSAAGPGPDQILEGGRGLFESRGVSLERLQRGRALAVALWITRQAGMVTLLVLLAALALTREPAIAARLLGLSWGVAAYLLLLGGGLGLLAQLCHRLGQSRGQLLFLGVIVLPQLLSPAWPALPTLTSGYAQLLDRCLGLEALP
jgi:hypothetical protein